MGVTIIHSKPEIFDRCEKEFGISWDNTIFAVDPHIHTKHPISDDLIEHELVHIQQQRDFGGVDEWWEEYFNNPQQRLVCELEAYRQQYKFLKDRVDRETLFRFVHFWASNLSGKTYGYLIKLDEAIKRITHV